MDGHCQKHVFEPTEGLCRTCGGEFCGDCLVYSHGRKRPPYCVDCALAAAGVRSTAARPKVRSRRQMRRDMKEHHRRAKLAAKASASDTSDLFDATTIPASGRPEMEFEFTIGDDGSIERPESPDAEAAEPEAPQTVSLFDQVEPVEEQVV